MRWYPAAWRRRYGLEFAALLEAEIAERPWSPRRTIDIAVSGLTARFAAAGFAPNSLLDERADARARLGALGCCTVVFLVCAIGLWSQLTIGWQRSEPSGRGVRIAMTVMTVLVPVLLALGVLAAAPVIVSVACAVRRGPLRDLWSPVALASCGASVLIVGSALFDHGWPGTGGHDWAGRH